MEKKHSGMGIASFTISIIVFCSYVFLIIMAVLASGQHNQAYGNPSKIQSIIGIAMIFLNIIAIVAVGLGIATLFQKERKRLLGIIGLIFSSSMLFIMISVIYMSSHNIKLF